MAQSAIARRQGQLLATATDFVPVIKGGPLATLFVETPLVAVVGRQAGQRLHVWQVTAHVWQADAGATGVLSIVNGSLLQFNYYDSAGNYLFSVCPLDRGPIWPYLLRGNAANGPVGLANACSAGKVGAGDDPVLEVEAQTPAVGSGILSLSGNPSAPIGQVSASIAVNLTNADAVNDHNAVGYVAMVYNIEA